MALTTGVSIFNSKDVTVSDGNFRNLDVGISAHNTDNLKFDRNTFDDVTLPYDISGSGRAEVSDTKITGTPREISFGHRSFAGYLPAMGPPLPAQCDDCKAVYASQNYKVSVPVFLVKRNTETCKECGSPNARLAEGVFDLSQEFLRILEGGKLTFAMAAALSSATASYLTGNSPAETAILAVAAASPSLGAAYERTAKSKHLFEYATLLISALALAVSVYQASDNSVSSVLEALQQGQINTNRILEEGFRSVQEVKVVLPFQGPVPLERPDQDSSK